MKGQPMKLTTIALASVLTLGSTLRGGSIRGDDGVETADLIRRGLVTRNGLTSSGLEVFEAALKLRYETGRTEAP
jgi:hypothetical protein